MNSNTLFIRPSHALSFDNCPKAYYYKYVLGIKTEFVSANLPFGTAVHEACTGYVLAQANNDTTYDPVKVFTNHWEHALNTQAIEFSSTWSPDDFSATGKRLAELFPDAWDNTGYAPLIDDQGPVVERRFNANIGDGIVLTGQPDIIAMDAEGSVIPLDLKTSAAPYGENFLAASEQLTDYQLLVEANRESLGLGDEDVAKVAFFEGVKKKIPKTSRGRGPEFLTPMVSSARSEAVKAERRQKLLWMAEDVRRGRFPKRPRMAYNSPCEMCEFASYCLNGDDAGLVFPESPQQSIVTDQQQPVAEPLI